MADAGARRPAQCRSGRSATSATGRTSAVRVGCQLQPACQRSHSVESFDQQRRRASTLSLRFARQRTERVASNAATEQRDRISCSREDGVRCAGRERFGTGTGRRRFANFHRGNSPQNECTCRNVRYGAASLSFRPRCGIGWADRAAGRHQVNGHADGPRRSGTHWQFRCVPGGFSQQRRRRDRVARTAKSGRVRLRQVR